MAARAAARLAYELATSTRTAGPPPLSHTSLTLRARLTEQAGVCAAPRVAGADGRRLLSRSTVFSAVAMRRRLRWSGSAPGQRRSHIATARGERAGAAPRRRRGPWTRHNDTRDFVTVPPHRAIRGGSDRESTDHTTPPYDASMRTPARTRPRESEKPGRSTALSKFFPSLTPARRGLFFQTSQGRNGIRARPRAAPRVMSDPTARTHGHTHTCVPMRTSPERGAPPKLYTLLHGESTKKNAQGKRGA